MNLADLSIKEFLNKTASGAPVPGGGSAAALSASVAAGLVEMVANLTVGKKGYEAAESEMLDASKAAAGLREKLILGIDEDSNAYNGVLAAYKLPKITDDEKDRRKNAIQDALKTAALIPLGVAEKALEVMKLAEKVLQKGNKNAVTDGAVGTMMARTAVMSALYNVKINLSGIDDAGFVNNLSEKVDRIEREALDKEEKILSGVRL